MVAACRKSNNGNVWSYYGLRVWSFLPFRKKYELMVERKAILMVIEIGFSASQASAGLQLKRPSTHLNVFWISSLDNGNVKLNMSKIRLLTFPSYHFPPTILSVLSLATPFPTC